MAALTSITEIIRSLDEGFISNKVSLKPESVEISGEPVNVVLKNNGLSGDIQHYKSFHTYPGSQVTITDREWDVSLQSFITAAMKKLQLSTTGPQPSITLQSITFGKKNAFFFESRSHSQRVLYELEYNPETMLTAVVILLTVPDSPSQFKFTFHRKITLGKRGSNGSILPIEDGSQIIIFQSKYFAGAAVENLRPYEKDGNAIILTYNISLLPETILSSPSKRIAETLSKWKPSAAERILAITTTAKSMNFVRWVAVNAAYSCSEAINVRVMSGTICEADGNIEIKKWDIIDGSSPIPRPYGVYLKVNQEIIRADTASSNVIILFKESDDVKFVDLYSEKTLESKLAVAVIEENPDSERIQRLLDDILHQLPTRTRNYSELGTIPELLFNSPRTMLNLLHKKPRILVNCFPQMKLFSKEGTENVLSAKREILEYFEEVWEDDPFWYYDDVITIVSEEHACKESLEFQLKYLLMIRDLGCDWDPEGDQKIMANIWKVHSHLSWCDVQEVVEKFVPVEGDHFQLLLPISGSCGALLKQGIPFLCQRLLEYILYTLTFHDTEEVRNMFRLLIETCYEHDYNHELESMFQNMIVEGAVLMHHYVFALQTLLDLPMEGYCYPLMRTLAAKRISYLSFVIDMVEQPFNFQYLPDQDSPPGEFSTFLSTEDKQLKIVFKSHEEEYQQQMAHLLADHLRWEIPKHEKQQKLSNWILIKNFFSVSTTIYTQNEADFVVEVTKTEEFYLWAKDHKEFLQDEFSFLVGITGAKQKSARNIVTQLKKVPKQ